MTYDLLIRNGRIVDGSGMPAFRGDVGVKDGKIVEIGKINGAATRTVDADGLAVSPGFIDNHCHYDAQVTWDPLCTFSPQHGATTVIFGNCSLSLAPVRRGNEERMAEFLSYVEAIPMEVLRTVDVNWETFPQYMDRLDNKLGVNAGTLIGHTAVRYYAMGEDCQKRTATDDEIKTMQAVVRDGMQAGAIGFSGSRQKGHFDPQGVPIPALWADEREVFALADVLRELGTGTVQMGGGVDPELADGMMARLAEASGRPVIYNSLSQTVRTGDKWKQHIARVDETAPRRHPRLSDVQPEPRDAGLHHEELPGVPRAADLASDPDLVGRGQDARLRRPAGARQAACRGGGAVGADLGRHRVLQDLVGLHVGERAGTGEEQGAAVQDHRRDRQAAEQARDRRVPGSGRRGEAGDALPAGREQHRR